MKYMEKIAFLVFLLLFALVSLASGATLTISWDPSPEPDISGYIVFVGESSEDYSSRIDVGNVTSYTVNNLEEGKTYYLAVKAVDYGGNESAFSDEISYLIESSSDSGSGSGGSSGGGGGGSSGSGGSSGAGSGGSSDSSSGDGSGASDHTDPLPIVKPVNMVQAEIQNSASHGMSVNVIREISRVNDSTPVEIRVTGGTPPYNIEVANPEVASVDRDTLENEGSVFVTGLTDGVTSITITDTGAPPSQTVLSIAFAPVKPVGSDPGPEIDTISPSEYIDLVLNVSNSRGIAYNSIAQEWFVFGVIKNGFNTGALFITESGIKDFVNANRNPSESTFPFEHNSDKYYIGTLRLEDLGLQPGDVLWYGYAYSKNGIDSFLGASDLVFENCVVLIVGDEE